MLVENSTDVFLGMQGMQAMCVRPHLNSNREAVRGVSQSNLAAAVAVKVKFTVALDWISSNKTLGSLRQLILTHVKHSVLALQINPLKPCD
jgi:hypothetical protein